MQRRERDGGWICGGAQVAEESPMRGSFIDGILRKVNARELHQFGFKLERGVFLM